MLLQLARWHVPRSACTIAPPTLSRLKRRAYILPAGLLDDLTHRGFIQDITRVEALHNALVSDRQVVYAGIDPTAKSLHVGHLIPLMCLFHFQIRGHTIIPLIGGATGLIGDPSGRFTEREPVSAKTIEHNVANLTENVKKFFKRALVYADDRVVQNKAICIDANVTSNLPWYKNLNLLEFLQTAGVHARVNTMLNRESVRARLESQQGISFTEFTYQLLQAYDFYHLYKNYGCSVQVGGSDQWGNILAGLELISRLDAVSPPNVSIAIGSAVDRPGPKLPPKAFGITTPLFTTAAGQKLGKSAGNAVWLNPKMTSVFDFYQFFLKTPDADVERYLKLFTLLSRRQIREIVCAHEEQPEKRIAQRRLAAEVTELVHLKSGLAQAETLTNLLFESDYSSLKATHIFHAFEDDPRLKMVDENELFSTPVIKLAAKHELVSSISGARMLVLSRGFYLNNEPLPEPQFRVTRSHLIDNRLVILRAGKDRLLILATYPQAAGT